MKTGKEKILESIRINIPVTTAPLPEDTNLGDYLSVRDLKSLFKENLLLVGGIPVEITGDNELNAYISKEYPEAVDFSNKPAWMEYPVGNQKDKLEKLITVIVKGQFGVAENAAIWIDDKDFPDRLIPFISQHVIIILDPAKIVRNMHEAYRLVEWNGKGFGLFVSGPSKTADIEQSLVYGAHGPVQLTVLLCQDSVPNADN